MGSSGKITGQITIRCKNVNDVHISDMDTILTGYKKYSSESFIIDSTVFFGDYKLTIQKNIATNEIFIKFDEAFDKITTKHEAFVINIIMIIYKIECRTNIIECDGFFNVYTSDMGFGNFKIYIDENMKVIMDHYIDDYDHEKDEFIWYLDNNNGKKIYWDDNTNPKMDWYKGSHKLNILDNGSIIVL
jgi:hypothetical protein